MDRLKDNNAPEYLCPYLGLVEDPDTPRSYPSEWNRCFHVKPAAPLALEYQYGYCLSPLYPECEIYTGGLVTTLPDGIRGNQSKDKKRKKHLIKIGTTLGVLLLVGLFIWLVSADGLFGFFRGGFSTVTPTSWRSSPTPLSFRTTTFSSTGTITSTNAQFFLWSSLFTPSPTIRSGGTVGTPLPPNSAVPSTYTPVP